MNLYELCTILGINPLRLPTIIIIITVTFSVKQHVLGICLSLADTVPCVINP